VGAAAIEAAAPTSHRSLWSWLSKNFLARTELDAFFAPGLARGPACAQARRERTFAVVNHVVDGATRIASKRDGRVVGRGVVVGSDPARDVALARAERPLEGFRFRFAARSPRWLSRSPRSASRRVCR
jgi:S1-C subfamily serine protease